MLKGIFGHRNHESGPEPAVQHANTNGDAPTDPNAPAVTSEQKLDKVANWFGRLGFGAKSGVYGLTGGFLIAAALTGSGTKDMGGAQRAIAKNTIGKVFLGILTFGLILYVLWRLFECVAGLRVGGSKRLKDRIWKRFIPLASAAIYTVYIVANFGSIFKDGSSGSGNDTWSAAMLRHTYGRVLFFIAGLVLIGLFCWQMYESISGNFKKELKPRDSSAMMKVVYGFGYVGIIGRAVLFLWLGVTFIRLVFTPSLRRDGIGGAIGEIKRNWAGKTALFIAGALLIIYAIYCILCVRYRKFIEEGQKDLPPGGITGMVKDAGNAGKNAVANVADGTGKLVTAPMHV